MLKYTNVDVNHMNKPGWTALLEAIIYGDGGPKYQEAIHVLIEHGADVHLADAKGISPLQHAQSRGFQEISNILIQAHALIKNRKKISRRLPYNNHVWNLSCTSF
ncbi:ankyrin repeat domain-containing protein [Lysinibacillus fusiformis]|uniref:ankyrin repeat domain-containing protein n=1 Tax=Lysinibacillus fusiformis TaxID=28031 RepID=UPI00384AA797